MIDACTPSTPVPPTGGTAEGDNEILALRNGDADLPVSEIVSSVAYYNLTEPMSPPTGGQDITDTLVSNIPYIDALNEIADCDPPLFVDGFTAGTIPAGAPFWIMDGNPGPGFPYDFSHLCLNGPIFLIFSSDSTWSSIGNFKNNDAAGSGDNGDSLRYLRIDYSGFDDSCSPVVYNYIPNSLLNQAGTSTGAGNYDGGYVHFDPAGGAAVDYLNDGSCSPFQLFPPPATTGDDAICQTTGGEQPEQFETTFCDDNDPCTRNVCSVDLEAEVFTPGTCSNPPVECTPGDVCCPLGTPAPTPLPTDTPVPTVTPLPPPFTGLIEGSGNACALSGGNALEAWSYALCFGVALLASLTIRRATKKARTSK